MDKNAFVFSLTFKTKHPIVQNIGYSITHDAEYLPVFCGGFGISGNEHDTGKTNQGLSNLGSVYAVPQGMKYLDPMTAAYLAGSHEFVLEEIEVFKVYS